ncbi:MAG: SagB/ThcOx family dehydrogenase, partial [Chloroflexi bacterium]|nr:SagB/ThcOx family dehydrogenase [Chloroflexota bacterium]
MADQHLEHDPLVLSSAVYTNGFRLVQPSLKSTGLRTSELRYDALREQQQTRIAEEFLVNSRLRRRDTEVELSIGSYFLDTTALALALQGQEGAHGTQFLSLPPVIPLRLGFGEAVRRRRSIRSFTGEALSLAYLGTLLRIAGGITGSLEANVQGASLALHSAPSAGGLYPIQLFIAALRIDGLNRGIYLFDPYREGVWSTGDSSNADQITTAFAPAEQANVADAVAAVVLLIGRPWRSMRKYGARGMRHLFLEAGAIAEHLNLAATALGIGSVDCSSLYDDEVHEALHLDGLYEALVHAVLI